MTLSIAFFIDSVPLTAGVINGDESLGGSESAMLGLARALQARGHRVSIYATKLSPSCVGFDRWGVQWFPADVLGEPDGWQSWDVFVSLRMPAVFSWHRDARLRVLWCQDLMNGEQFKGYVMACAWAYDAVAYVSQYHRAQWEGQIPELAPLGYVTRNGFDPAHVPADAVKDPNRLIHISRPERGLEPLLEMWPLLKYHKPEATLQICRYSSMYDAEGWGVVCKDFDRQVQAVNAQIGGITYLGELGKADLYQAISEAAVMWYPGVPTFAETSCIAALEAQACGTPFVGSFKGALTETVPSGVLVRGDAFARGYQQESVDAVVALLEDCKHDRRRYRDLQAAGRIHVERYTYAAIAAEWEQWITETFQTRYEANKLGVLRSLLHHDDHTAAKLVAREITEDYQVAHGIPDKPGLPQSAGGHYAPTSYMEAIDAGSFCDRVIAGQEHTAETYAKYAVDTLYELNRHDDRHTAVMEAMKGRTHVLDVACGNGAYALGLCERYPDIRVTAIDYSQGNIDAAKAAAAQLGYSDRIEFLCQPVWDFDTQRMSDWWVKFSTDPSVPEFDGLWCGEFAEHVSDCATLIDHLEQVVQLGGTVVYSVPYGPLGDYKSRAEPHPRSHVHHFRLDDVRAVFGPKQDLSVRCLPWPGVTSRDGRCGNWVIQYTAGDALAGQRPYAQTIVTTRPFQRLSVAILASNDQFDIGKCLESVWSIADEIVIGLCASTDGTRRLCQEFDVLSERGKIRLLDLPAVADHPDGFSGARNAVLAACTGDWHLMIDTDERLLSPHAIRKYLDGGAFVGYVIRQNHLQIDAPNHFDSPVRLFKRDQPIQYYGCVHEQPQMGDCNGDVHPALEVGDAAFAHTGYLISAIRREKLFLRNLPLVARDQERFPDRLLGKLLVARDCVHLGEEEQRISGGDMTPEAHSHYERSVQLFREHFADPGNKYHELARPFYERALQALGLGMEVEWAFAGKPGGLNGSHAKPHVLWVQTQEELDQRVQFRLKQAYKQMTSTPMDVEPIAEVTHVLAPK